MCGRGIWNVFFFSRSFVLFLLVVISYFLEVWEKYLRNSGY